VRVLLGQYPDSGFAWKLLGAAQQMQGTNALSAFRKTTELMPDDAEAHFNLGVVQKGLGQLNEAMVSYQRALKLKPDYAEAHGNLGNVLKDLGQLDEAVACFRNALKIRPDSAEAHNNLGTALKELGRFDEALASYRLALTVRPDFADALFNQGNILMATGKLDDAVVSYRKTIALKPAFADAYLNLGTSLKERNQFDDAIASYQRVIELKPGSAEAYGNIGSILKELGQIDGAIENYRRALELKPDYVEAQSSLLFILNYTARHTHAFRLEEARRYGRMIAEKVSARFDTWQCEKQPQRLRVGMVSGDLRSHPVGYFLESLLAHIDPARVELIAYPTNLIADALTAGIKPHFAAWKPLSGLNDEAAARLIHADGVHVLLDISGHTAHNRLPVFAWKPAPVQIAWLGYFATTGVVEMDYLVADRVGVPKAHRSDFSEQVRYLPETRLCFSPPEVDLPVAPLPAKINGHITFGCFQSLSKIGDEVLAAWASVLVALPGSRLRIQCKQLGDSKVAEQMLQRLHQLGIDPVRVALLGGVSREAYLAAHAEVDMLLDTFPYPGGTTTCEALWMGVPTLTLAGDTLLSRQGASMLTTVGLEDWIATSVEDYAARALAFARDLPELAALRAALRKRVRMSPLFDAPRFAHDLEDALWSMWREQTEKIPVKSA